MILACDIALGHDEEIGDGGLLQGSIVICQMVPAVHGIAQRDYGPKLEPIRHRRVRLQDLNDGHRVGETRGLD